jgi:hypothetical protein
MEELAAMLGREHVQLEFLLFKLLQLQHLLRSEDPRFLRWSAEEIKRASQRVCDIERERATRVRTLALAAGIPANQVTLSALAEAVPEPWRTIYRDHCLGYSQLAREVDAALFESRRLADASGHAVADVLQHIDPPARPGLLPLQVLSRPPLVLP